jgi:NMD protein affecting ribosome stability and mRNA decay
VQEITRERLCCRCGKAPVVYLIRLHRAGLCGLCYLENLGLLLAPSWRRHDRPA